MISNFGNSAFSAILPQNEGASYYASVPRESKKFFYSEQDLFILIEYTKPKPIKTNKMNTYFYLQDIVASV